MEHGSAPLISILLAGVICAFAVVEGAERCNFNASLVCVGGPRQDRGKPSIDRIFNFLKEEDFNGGCNNFTRLRTCVKEKTKDCDIDEKNHWRKIWLKIDDSVTHVCDKNRQAFIQERKCLSKPGLSNAAKVCESAHSMRRRHARHTCSEYQEAVKCINDAIFHQCGTAGKNLMDRLVRNTLSLVDIDHDCEQSSSGRSKEDSVIISFIMCTASLMLALLLN